MYTLYLCRFQYIKILVQGMYLKRIFYPPFNQYTFSVIMLLLIGKLYNDQQRTGIGYSKKITVCHLLVPDKLSELHKCAQMLRHQTRIIRVRITIYGQRERDIVSV